MSQQQDQRPARWRWRPLQIAGRSQIAVIAGDQLHALLGAHDVDRAWRMCHERNATRRQTS